MLNKLLIYSPLAQTVLYKTTNCSWAPGPNWEKQRNAAFI